MTAMHSALRTAAAVIVASLVAALLASRLDLGFVGFLATILVAGLLVSLVDRERFWGVGIEPAGPRKRHDAR